MRAIPGRRDYSVELRSARALACSDRGPRRSLIVHRDESPFSDRITLSFRPAGAPVGTREGACAPQFRLHTLTAKMLSAAIVPDRASRAISQSSSAAQRRLPKKTEIFPKRIEFHFSR